MKSLDFRKSFDMDVGANYDYVREAAKKNLTQKNPQICGLKEPYFLPNIATNLLKKLQLYQPTT